VDSSAAIDRQRSNELNAVQRLGVSNASVSSSPRRRGFNVVVSVPLNICRQVSTST